MAGEFRVRAMHDVTEGGVEGAIWEMAQALNIGVAINKEAIPVLESTKVVAEKAGVDLYRLISSGSMLTVLDKDDFEPMKEKLNDRGILFTKIGEVTDDNRVAYRMEDGSEKEIPSPGPDALYTALVRLQ